MARACFAKCVFCPRSEMNAMKHLIALSLLLFVSACDSGGDNEPGAINATTILTSSTLAPEAAAPKARTGTPRLRAGRTDFEVTPSVVTGEVLSVVFPIDPAPDDGIVVFGDGRPDIAATSAQLFAFDLGDPFAINQVIQIKPTLANGTVERVHPIFGYADFTYIQLDGVERTVRVAMGSVNGMTRGDKLLEIGTQFQWFDLDTGLFTATRPVNPAVIAEIRDFTDPIRPNLVFYPMVVNLTSTIPVTAADFLSASTVESEIDFIMSGALTLVGQTTSSLAEADLIQAFTLTQMLVGVGGASGFLADATLEALP
ncbi:MAG: hypothetical protein ACI9BV_003854 [Rhodothermales bacterium]|jgi:hypothetical protein